jgi:hypothetical protein
MNGKDMTWVFVGCGGTFYYATPYLSVLLARYKPKKVITVDPDQIDTESASRQWANMNIGSRYKAMLAHSALGLDLWDAESCSFVRWFNHGAGLAEAIGIGAPVVLVVNVDNHSGRLECQQWASSRDGMTGMVVSGCDGEKGQCVWGLYKDGEAVHNWMALHPDTYDTSIDERRATCGGQTVRANALTGQLVGACLEECMEAMLDSPVYPEQVSEFYWRTTPDLHLWRTKVLRTALWTKADEQRYQDAPQTEKGRE